MTSSSGKIGIVGGNMPWALIGIGIAFGFLVPIFFIRVGLDLDFEALMTSRILLLIPVILVVGVVVKVLPSLFDFTDEHTTIKKRLSKGVLLGSRLSLIIAASEIGKDLGVVSSGTQGAILVLAVISCIISPIAFKWIWRKRHA